VRTATLTVTLSRSSRATASFAAVCDANLTVVYRYLLQLVRHKELAEDLTAETFERALKSWSSFDAKRGTPGAWLVRIARNCAFDHSRAEGRRTRREQLVAVPEAVPAVEAVSGLSPRMHAAFDRLTAEQRELVALRVILEFDTADTAAVLGLSPSACTTALHRAMSKLRKELGDVRDVA
jgi:RNA polymerase sigma factor (sigma-70 family)